MLVALGRAVAGRMRNADQGDVGRRGVLVPGTPEKGWNSPPVPALRALPCRRNRIVRHLPLPANHSVRGYNIVPAAARAPRVPTSGMKFIFARPADLPRD